MKPVRNFLQTSSFTCLPVLVLLIRRYQSPAELCYHCYFILISNFRVIRVW
jgi:hypothetical protein